MPTLVVNQGALGDLLLSLPALRLLRQAKGEFTLAANPYLGLFLKHAGEVSSVIPSNASAFSELYIGTIPPLLQYFDDIWWFTRRRGLVPDVFLKPNDKWSSQVVFTVDEGPSRTNCALFQFHQVKNMLGMDDAILEDFLYPMSFSRVIEERNLFHLAVHPGSGSRKKCWPLDRFFQTIRAVINSYGEGNVLLILGPAEADMADEIKRFAQEQGGRLLYMEQQDLLLVAQTLGQTRYFLGNDSGISHLATWCGARSTILFGPTEAGLWSPPLPDTNIIESPARCSPCGPAYRRCQDVHCMEEIQVPQVSSLLRDSMRDM